VTTFAFVAAERANHAVATLGRVVGASVSGFYAWLRAIPSRQNRAEAEAALRGHISRIFVAKRRVYGAPRIPAELRREGHRHARRRIERLMRDMGLQASRGQRRKPETTNSRHDQPIAPNRLGRSFVAERPDAVWLADISYIPTDEGFLSLAAKGSGDASDCRLVDGRASQGRALHRRSGHGPPALPTPTGAHSP